HYHPVVVVQRSGRTGLAANGRQREGIAETELAVQTEGPAVIAIGTHRRPVGEDRAELGAVAELPGQARDTVSVRCLRPLQLTGTDVQRADIHPSRAPAEPHASIDRHLR